MLSEQSRLEIGAICWAGALLLFCVSNLGFASAVNSATITTSAGSGPVGFSGDGDLATDAKLNTPVGVTLDQAGNLYIADRINHRIRVVLAATNVITTIAGSGSVGPSSGGFSGDDGFATGAQLDTPSGVCTNGNGDLYIADTLNNRIRKVIADTGVITTVAGNGMAAYGGDNGLATEAQLRNPLGVAVDRNNDLYIADSNNNRIRKVIRATGVITTVAGSGVNGFSGDGGLAINAQLDYPTRVSVDKAGNLFVVDSYNHRVRKIIVATGIITTIVGSGSAGPSNGSFSGDGGLAINARLNFPTGIAIDAMGDLYIADNGNQRIRKVDAATGIITTVAGNGIAAYRGDNGPAIEASLNLPADVALDSQSNLYIADQDNHRIRTVETVKGVMIFLPIVMKN